MDVEGLERCTCASCEPVTSPLKRGDQWTACLTKVTSNEAPACSQWSCPSREPRRANRHALAVLPGRPGLDNQFYEAAVHMTGGLCRHDASSCTQARCGTCSSCLQVEIFCLWDGKAGALKYLTESHESDLSITGLWMMPRRSGL